jgi:hypothetical protein
MDDVTMNAHMTETRSHSYCLMRNQPEPTGSEVDHLHGESHRSVECPNSSFLQRRHDTTRSLVYMFTRLMELDISDRPSGIVNWFTIHANHETDQCLRKGKIAQDFISLSTELHLININKANVVSTRLKTEVA